MKSHLVRKCIVLNCDSIKIHGTDSFPFHRFPNDQELIEIWKQNLKIPDTFQFSFKHILVCSKHFEESAYATKKKIRLCKDAIPTLFLPPKIEVESKY